MFGFLVSLPPPILLVDVRNGKNGKANKAKSLIKASNAPKTQGTRIIKANRRGNNSVQQKLMSWSKRTRGREALTQINVNTKAPDLIPKTKPGINPSVITEEPEDNSLYLKFIT
jgi:hypothetical protein